ncbi:MobP3 family relaxase [Brevibacillus formosus]|uniref:MobP3 family relaxase n=1 Tax=Brevibacillus formosus TaxID=54913 RepID=UPI003F197AE3
MSKFASPLVVKMGFYMPSKTNNARNKAHVNYIATRPGVVKEVEPAIEDMIDPSTAIGHVKYAHERPGSHGLFGSNENTSLDDVKKELSSHNGMLWRMIVSLREDDACRLDMTSRRQWEQKMKASIPDVADKIGIPLSNLRWCAAFHNEPGHPHVHVMIWEKEPKRARGKLSQAERKEVRRVFAKEIYAEERIQLNREKTAERDLIQELIKSDIEQVVNLREDLMDQRVEVNLELRMAGLGKRGIAPVVPLKLGRELLNELKELSLIMPAKGRIALKFMPEEVKGPVTTLSDWLLSQPGVKIHVQRYLKAHEQLTKMHVLSPEKIEQARAKAYDDLKNRVSQVLLRSAAEVRESQNYEHVEHNTQNTKAPSVFTQTVFSSVFFTIQSEKDKAEAKSAAIQRKQGKKKRKRQRGEWEG